MTAPNGTPRVAVMCEVPEDGCPREAVELLLVRAVGESDWAVIGCCDLHPAADAAKTLLTGFSRQFEHLIVPLTGKDGAS